MASSGAPDGERDRIAAGLAAAGSERLDAVAHADAVGPTSTAFTSAGQANAGARGVAEPRRPERTERAIRVTAARPIRRPQVGKIRCVRRGEDPGHAAVLHVRYVVAERQPSLLPRRVALDVQTTL